MADKQCNRCGKRGLDWDQDFHRKTGKWKLDNHKTISNVWCNKPPEKQLLDPVNILRCELCSGSNFGYINLNNSNLEDHLKLMHPNGEALTELDYKIKFGLPKSYLRFWKSDPHYSNYIN